MFLSRIYFKRKKGKKQCSMKNMFLYTKIWSTIILYGYMKDRLLHKICLNWILVLYGRVV